MKRNTSGLKRGGSPGRPPGQPNKATKEIKAASQKILSDAAYQMSLKKRLAAGKAPHMEVLLHHYAFGKPKETVAHEGAIPPFILKIDADESDD